ncbi:MAG: GTPase Era [Anaerolineae bacterium]|nr:GTPase Era [Anaerolineae bacterium]
MIASEDVSIESKEGAEEPSGLAAEPGLDHRSGYVALVGRPSVGKSSLVNAYLGQKIAIVSPRAQTTRNQLLGILTRPEAQVIFVDLPGIHRPKHRLGELMVETAVRALPDADILLFMTDVSVPPTLEDRDVAKLLKEQAADRPVVLALNKSDLLKPADVVAHTDAYRALVDAADWVLVSATRGDNLEKLLAFVVAHLPLGPRYYPPDQVTDQQERFLAAELVREAVLHHTYQEVPHSITVVVEEFKERSETMTYIGATIYVERESQKGIVIGQGGALLKKIGTSARQSLEQALGCRVYLELWVKTRPHWRQRDEELRRLGYTPSG